jgi:hypothetical protein
MKTKPITRPFPVVHKLGRKSLVRASEFEWWKLAVLADAQGVEPPEYATPERETLRSLDDCATDLRMAKRTLYKLIKDTTHASR